MKNYGKQNYELIEYINDVNREYTEVLVEQNIFGKTDTSYVYGVERLSLDRYNGCSGYYLYDPRGSVTGITNERGQLYQSYRYDANGEITYGAPSYENEYTYNGESYNPNIESQYLRARYYDVVTANFLTEDTYLGNIIEPLTLNRYNYCVSSPLNYVDPSGNSVENELMKAVMSDSSIAMSQKGSAINERITLYFALETLEDANATFDYVMGFDYVADAVIYEEILLEAEKERAKSQNTSLGNSMEKAEDISEENDDYVNAEDVISKPDTPLYRYTEEHVSNIIVVDSKFDAERDKFKAAYEKNIDRYQELADEIGVPPELIAVIHYRENTKDYLEGNFNVYLHNGEQLGKKTEKVPKGIYFDNFDLAAEDAIKAKENYIEKYHLTAESNDIVAMMCFAEVYNGLGYYNNGHISPYLYSGTNIYTSGKYVEERNDKGQYVSVYKEEVVDSQIGAYILLNSILSIKEE